MTNKPLSSKNLKNIRKIMSVDKPAISLHIYLLDVEDPINIGSIIRACDGLDITTLYCSKITSEVIETQINDISKTSMGLHRRFNFIKKDLLEFIDLSRKDNFSVYGVDISTNSVNYKSISYPNKICIVLGNERIGIYKKYLDNFDRIIHIPMYGKGDSLNVAQALAIVGFFIMS